MAIDYEDFVLSFDPDPGEELRIRAKSPAGEGEERAPWQDEQLGRAILEAGFYRQDRPPARHLVLEGPAPPFDPTAEEVGRQLFDFAFRGRIRTLFDQSLGLTRALYRGLRIVLRFDVQDAAGQRLADLPWEMLYRPESGEFFVLDPRTPIVRYLDVAQFEPSASTARRAARADRVLGGRRSGVSPGRAGGGEAQEGSAQLGDRGLAARVGPRRIARAGLEEATLPCLPLHWSWRFR